jgi:benzoate transport
MLDGLDVVVISFAAPAIVDEWTIMPQALGIVFSAALVGMTLGAMFLAPLADVIGRRNMIMICIVIMASGVFLTAFAQNVMQLIVLRVFSGIGIGAMLASVATVAAEFSPDRYKNFIVSTVLAGYPIGATLAGLVAAQVIPELGWRVMFIISAVATIAPLPVIAFLMPESISFLTDKQPSGALDKLNRIFTRMGMRQLTSLPILTEQQNHSAVVSALLTPKHRRSTLLLWLAFFMAFVTLYFLISWIPKLARNTGLTLDLAIYAGTIFNLGAFFGIVVQGYFSQLFGLRRIIFIFFVATSILMFVFSLFTESVTILMMFGLMGFGVQGGFVGLYTVAARLYPTVIRATGIGWAIGAGRTGAIFGPMAGGVLVAVGLSMTANFVVFAIPIILAGIATMMIRNPDIR